MLILAIIIILNLSDYLSKLSEDTVAPPGPDQANGILQNATIVVLLKYLSNFWRLFEMPLINWKVELKLKRTKYCVLAAAGVDNANADSNNLILTIKHKKRYVPVVTLSVKDN